MASLLDIQTPEGQAALAAQQGLLAPSRGIRGIGQAILAANQAFAMQPALQRQAEIEKIRMSLLQSQVDENQAQTEARRASIDAARRKAEALPSLFGGMDGTLQNPSAQQSALLGKVGQSLGPLDAQAGGAPGSLNWMAALRAGYSPEEIQKLASLQDVGRPKATRQMEVDDGRGGKRIALVDDYGREVAGFSGYTAPVQVNQGDRVSFVKPEPGVSLAMNQSPDSKASNALGWANYGLSKQRLAQEAQAPKGQIVETPNGFMLVDQRAGTSQAVTGPDGQPLRGKGTDRNLTDAQAKANLFGSRMQESDRILKELEGKYSPAAVNAKMAAAEAPMVGGLAGTIGNAMLTKEGQMAEQAQRDFVNAVLRRESGAVISPQEFANAQKQYFPQPLDSPQVLEQKRRNRQVAIEGLMAEVPEGRRGVPSLNNGARPATASTPDNDPLGLRR